MLQNLQQLLAPAVMERVTLLVNHVLGGERVAMDRLAPHAGKVVELTLADWPALLPAAPPLAWRITPAGLLEWCGLERSAAAELGIRVVADNPALLAMRWLSGEQPPVEIAGDAQLATDINWLIENLRWDVAADLERLFPPAVADAVHRAGSMLARGLRTAVQQLDGLTNRWR